MMITALTGLAMLAQLACSMYLLGLQPALQFFVSSGGSLQGPCSGRSCDTCQPALSGVCSTEGRAVLC